MAQSTFDSPVHPAAIKEQRIQKVIAVVEEVLGAIAGEHETPQAMAPVLIDFFSELQLRLLRVSHVQLSSFLKRDLGEPMTTDYCKKCGHSPDSAEHYGLTNNPHDYQDPRE